MLLETDVAGMTSRDRPDVRVAQRVHDRTVPTELLPKTPRRSLPPQP
jgi:hypothetical protein